MVTGAYYPELSGAGLQCRTIIRGCGDAVRFSVLTTAVDPALPRDDEVEGVPVRRVLVSVRSRIARWLKAPQLIQACLGMARQVDILHLHGFSAKSLVAVAIAKLLGKKVVVTLTSVGHDDAVSMRAKGLCAFRSFRTADRFVAISPRFGELHDEVGLPPEKYRLIPYAVDLERFRAPRDGERRALRRELGLDPNLPLVLFVGFFSHEKCPDLLFDAWTDTFASTPASGLVLVGATRAGYYEIDSRLADRIRSNAVRLRCADRLVMAEPTAAIEKYYRAVDVFVLPSKREGLPNVVLEAMSSALPCVVSRLRGVTDSMITDGIDGLLVEPSDRHALAGALRTVLTDLDLRTRLGAAGRRTVEARFSLATIAAEHVKLYRELTSSEERPDSR
jgi:glycosyltransferase involved in cell wall biosynthesis